MINKYQNYVFEHLLIGKLSIKRFLLSGMYYFFSDICFRKCIRKKIKV